MFDSLLDIVTVEAGNLIPKSVCTSNKISYFQQNYITVLFYTYIYFGFIPPQMFTNCKWVYQFLSNVLDLPVATQR